MSILAKTGQMLFHTSDLSMLWRINNANSLRVTISRFIKMGLLHRIQRGLYSTGNIQEIDPLRIASAMLHRYCYVSTETILRDEGIILQSIEAITMISSVSRKWQTLGRSFQSRRLHRRFLQHPAGITLKKDIHTANKIRAVADLLFFDPWYAFDAPIDWKKVKTMQQDIGYPLTPHRYGTPRIP